MDRFKFRVWDKGYSKYYYDAENTFEENQVLGIDYFGQYLNDDDFIVEQCTGLKDKNGKLIYEGDILKSVFSDEKLYEVIWCADCYKLRVFTKSSRKTLEYLGLKNTKTSYEVIGNIHEGVNNENK